MKHQTDVSTITNKSQAILCLELYEKNHLKITRSDKKSTSSSFEEKSWEHTLDLKLGKKREWKNISVVTIIFKIQDFFKKLKFC